MQLLKRNQNGLEVKDLPKDCSVELNKFLSGLDNIKFLKPDGRPDAQWKVFSGSTLDEAFRSAYSAAKNDAGTNATLNSSYHETWHAANTTAHFVLPSPSIREDASDRVRYAAAVIAESKVIYAEPHTARLAARDAELMACLISIKDVDFKDKEKHFAQAEARMNVWAKGYALAADVKGVFYVYYAASHPTSQTGKGEGLRSRLFDSFRRQ